MCDVCLTRLHVNITRHNECVYTDMNLFEFVPKPTCTSIALPYAATPNQALLISMKKQSLNFAICGDPDPEKPQAKGLVPNLQYRIHMDTLYMSGHTDVGYR